MIVLTLTAVQMNVVDLDDNPDGVTKMFQFVDPQSGIQINVPLVAEVCDGIAAALGSSGKLQVARSMPQGLPDMNGGG